MSLAPSKWGNQYRVRDYGRDGCLVQFETSLRSSPKLWGALPELSGMKLACRCKASQRCHADVLIKCWHEALAAPTVLPRNSLVPLPAQQQVFSRPLVLVELFAGLLPLACAAEKLGLQVAAAFYSEVDADALLVAATSVPEATCLGPVESIVSEVVKDIVTAHPDAVICIGAGPPCTDTTLLKHRRSGSAGAQSALRCEYARVFQLFQVAVPPDRLVGILECTRMPDADRVQYNSIHGSQPFEVCSRWFTAITRPRWWWFSNVPQWPADTTTAPLGQFPGVTEVFPSCERLTPQQCLEPGWEPLPLSTCAREFGAVPMGADAFAFRCLTRHHKDRAGPMESPRGLARCDQATRDRWHWDGWAQAPYQYESHNLVIDKRRQREPRRLVAAEEERLHMFPDGWTAPLLQLDLEPAETERRRRSLLGNSWHVGVAMFILQAAVLPLMGQAQAVSAGPTWSPAQRLSPSEPLVRAVGLTVLQQYDLLIASLADTIVDSHAKCPYIRDRIERGLPVDQPLGPDPLEMWAARTMLTAGGVQTRALGFASSRRRLVPRGLPPLTHVQLAQALDSPLDGQVALADDLDFACRMMVKQTNYGLWQKQQWRVLMACMRCSRELGVLLEACRSVMARTVAPDLNPHFLDLAGRSVGWPDLEVPWAACCGVNVVGEVPMTGVFRQADVQPTVELEEFLQGADCWNASLVQAAPPKAEQAQVIWDKSAKEQEVGVLGQWQSKDFFDQRFGRGCWRALKRFAVYQAGHESWRVIDNGLSSSHNDTARLLERIHTTTSEVSMAIIQRLFALLRAAGRSPVPVHRATRDMKRAYRQVSVMEHEQPFHIVCAWHLEEQQWRFAELRGLAFGLTASVIHFNRMPAHLTAVARRWLGLPVTSFYDDFKLLALDHEVGHVWGSFSRLVTQAGWLFDQEKDSHFASTGPFLGFIEHLEHAHSTGKMWLEVKPSFDDRLQAALEDAIATGELSSGAARSLRGMLLHRAAAFTGRVGRGQCHAIAEHIAHGEMVVGPALLRCLQFHLELRRLNPLRTVDIVLNARLSVTLYTDAAA